MPNVIINNVDFSPEVQESTYIIDSSYLIGETYTSADGKLHKLVRREKIKGSFEVVFADGYNTHSIDEFMSAVNSATTDKVLTITLSDNRTASGTLLTNVEVYFEIKCDPPRKIVGSNAWYRKVKLSYEEQ